jgi:membrane protease subunit (stomatin/prohibitin family)
MGAGVGMGVAAGGVFNGMAQQMFAPMNGGVQQQQQAPVRPLSSGRFTQQSDVNASNSTAGAGSAAAEDPMETLGKLKKLLDAGLIEQSEYDAKKREVLSRI